MKKYKAVCKVKINKLKGNTLHALTTHAAYAHIQYDSMLVFPYRVIGISPSSVDVTRRDLNVYYSHVGRTTKEVPEAMETYYH